MTPQVRGAGSSTFANARAPQKEDIANRYVILRPKGIGRPRIRVSLLHGALCWRNVSDLLRRSSERSLERIDEPCCGILRIAPDLRPA